MYYDVNVLDDVNVLVDVNVLNKEHGHVFPGHFSNSFWSCDMSPFCSRSCATYVDLFSK